jgi:tryptophan synthase alpha chain
VVRVEWYYGTGQDPEHAPTVTTHHPPLSSPSRIAGTFAGLKARGRMAFMPFITAGDPDLATTAAVIRELAARGVDLIEVGFPYSDPIADGPVVQASYTRALRRGIRVRDIFEQIGKLSEPAGSHPALPPLVAMVSYSIILRHGVERFLDEAHQAGFSGLIVPDLPGDEGGRLPELARARGLDVVQLISPTTPPDRAERILQASAGFVYCISVAGTTGVRAELPAALREQLQWLRTKTDLPLAVGFGISRPEQIAGLRDLADGVIVGSAIVRQLEALSGDAARTAAVVQAVGQFAATMLDAASA